MTLAEHISDLEKEKFFRDPTDSNNVTVRTSSKGTFTPSGLQHGGRDTIMTAVSSEWRKIERSATSTPTGSGPLNDRNSLRITNYGTVDVYTTVNPSPNSPLQALPVGGKIFPENSEYLDVKEKDPSGNSLDVWVRSSGLDCVVFFRELS